MKKIVNFILVLILVGSVLMLVNFAGAEPDIDDDPTTIVVETEEPTTEYEEETTEYEEETTAWYFEETTTKYEEKTDARTYQDYTDMEETEIIRTKQPTEKRTEEPKTSYRKNIEVPGQDSPTWIPITLIGLSAGGLTVINSAYYYKKREDSEE